MKDNTPPETTTKKKRLTHWVGTVGPRTEKGRDKYASEDCTSAATNSNLRAQKYASKCKITRLEMLFYANYLCMRKDLLGSRINTGQSDYHLPATMGLGKSVIK